MNVNNAQASGLYGSLQTAAEPQQESAWDSVSGCFMAGLKTGAYVGGVVLAVGIPYALISHLVSRND